MGFYTDWFLADEAEARAIVESDGTFDDWPSLSLKGIGAMDLMALWAIVRGNKDDLKSVSGKLLFRGPEEGPFVSRVLPAFIDALAGITTADQQRIASEWGQSECLSDWDSTDVLKAIHDLSEFAKQATRANKPVLQLSVLGTS